VHMLYGDQISPRLSADSIGTQTGEQGHFPFGETWYESGYVTKWKFTSYEREAGTGSAGDLDYAVYRSHYPRPGRFTSPDPVAGSVIDPQSLNRYAYSRNDPINLTDPLGLDPIICFNRWGYFYPCKGGHFSGGGGGAYPLSTLCYLDGAETPCGFVHSLLGMADAVTRCPNDQCHGAVWDQQSQQWILVEWRAYSQVSGYYRPSDLAGGVYEYQGKLYTPSQWARLVQPMQARERMRILQMLERAGLLPLLELVEAGGNYMIFKVKDGSFQLC